MSRLRILMIGAALTAAACGSSTTPTTPDEIQYVTDTFSGNVSINGGVTHRVVVSRSGVVSAALTQLQPDTTVILGLQIGAWNGSACVVPTIVNDNATINVALEGQSDRAGDLCVRVYDSGKLSTPTTYQLQVVHP